MAQPLGYVLKYKGKIIGAFVATNVDSKEFRRKMWYDVQAGRTYHFMVEGEQIEPIPPTNKKRAAAIVDIQQKLSNVWKKPS